MVLDDYDHKAARLKKSPNVALYKDKMTQCVNLIYPEMNPIDLDHILDDAIVRRYKESPAYIDNSYTHKQKRGTLLDIADYIEKRRPIKTAFGTLFEQHEHVPNPLAKVVDQFLQERKIYKKKMFKYPKGSEMYEKYNLLQQLSKIDVNGIYGTIGLYVSAIYNNNTATSITSEGRALTSSATMLFEGFLGNNLKFGSLNEVVEYVNNIVHEKPNRKFNSFEWLDNFWDITREDLFARLVINFDYRRLPSDQDLEIIWKICQNLNQEEINRVYYKNHLYAFLDGSSKAYAILEKMMKDLSRPFMTVGDAPENIKDDLILFRDLLVEYVYYGYMVMDRIDKTMHMIRNIVMVSDTDSTIISLDAWYRYNSERLKGKKFRIMNDYNEFIPEGADPEPGILFVEDGIEFAEKVYDYNFNTDEIIEGYKFKDPSVHRGYNNIKYTLVNIMAYVLDYLINDYMVKLCINAGSITDERPATKCRINMKNEFFLIRLLMTQVKKNYASLIGIQEGNILPENKQLDVKGIECMTKSSKALSTRKALKKILEEDILKADVIDQLKFLKDIIILEKRIDKSIREGSKEYYKPATIKSVSAYDDPMRIQGIKASVAWNALKDKDLPAINLQERNAIDIVKVNISRENIDKIKDTYPEIYENMVRALNMNEFKKMNKEGTKVLENCISAVAIPLDVTVPEWLMEFIDYPTLINNNLGQFPYESIGIVAGPKNSNTSYTNIIQF